MTEAKDWVYVTWDDGSYSIMEATELSKLFYPPARGNNKIETHARVTVLWPKKKKSDTGTIRRISKVKDYLEKSLKADEMKKKAEEAKKKAEEAMKKAGNGQVAPTKTKVRNARKQQDPAVKKVNAATKRACHSAQVKADRLIAQQALPSTSTSDQEVVSINQNEIDGKHLQKVAKKIPLNLRLDSLKATDDEEAGDMREEEDKNVNEFSIDSLDLDSMMNSMQSTNSTCACPHCPFQQYRKAAAAMSIAKKIVKKAMTHIDLAFDALTSLGETTVSPPVETSSKKFIYPQEWAWQDPEGKVPLVLTHVDAQGNKVERNTGIYMDQANLETITNLNKDKPGKMAGDLLKEMFGKNIKELSFATMPEKARNVVYAYAMEKKNEGTSIKNYRKIVNNACYKKKPLNKKRKLEDGSDDNEGDEQELPANNEAGNEDIALERPQIAPEENGDGHGEQVYQQNAENIPLHIQTIPDAEPQTKMHQMHDLKMPNSAAPLQTFNYDSMMKSSCFVDSESPSSTTAEQWSGPGMGSTGTLVNQAISVLHSNGDKQGLEMLQKLLFSALNPKIVAPT